MTLQKCFGTYQIRQTYKDIKYLFNNNGQKCKRKDETLK
jgi:hypothetical protein